MQPSPSLGKASEIRATPEARREFADTVRPIIQALARVIATDRRAVVLANQKAEILLANVSAQRLVIAQDQLLSHYDWPELCAKARRAGSVPAKWTSAEQEFEGELVHIPMGPAEGFLLRLAESDQESTWLRNRSRAAMLMRVAHDLRTPIQSLLASAESLTAAHGQPEVTEDTTQRMRRAAELALDHISNVLAVVRGEQGRRGGHPDEDFSIAQEVQALIAMITPIAEARATEVTLQLNGPEDLTLHGPLRFVRALCQNLIDNSVNHGGGKVALTLTAAPLLTALPDAENEDLWSITLELRDEGGGLPPAQRAKLTEALGLAPDDTGVSAPTDRPQRPSAGLNVMAHALRQLGGKITLADRASDGAPAPEDYRGRVIGTVITVTFSLPRAPDMTARPAPLPAATTPLAGRKILLVEDSPSSRDWLCHVLQSAGAEVLVAGSGPECLAMVARSEIAANLDLVLTDVTLPRMSGIELAARLRRGDPGAAVIWRGKVVGLTAHADDKIRAACLQAGMVHMLEKPLRPAMLCQTLEAILAGDPLRSPDAPAQTLAHDPRVTEDLIAQLGTETAQRFMRRALTEATTILGDLSAEGVVPDTGRRLHAATGACGLTGLREIELALRAIELAVEGGKDPSSLLARLQTALTKAEHFIEALQP